ncbi:MAG TPA: MFS transporter [Thiolinea sp.]|nr:MFS transporter [Thiolinea sp.]
MNSLEWRVALSLSSVYAVRMLGLFMILPVFSLYAQKLPGATEVLTGLAIGIYGFTQALFQIPLGLASDRIGRKPVIIGGLLIFAFGSLVAALADSIWLIILGRTLQGMGAIAAATMALAADLVREEVRARIMAFIGMSIGISFMVAMILGPLVNAWAGLSGIFWFTLALSLIGIALIAFVVPAPVQVRAHRDAGILRGQVWKVLKNPTLLRMDAGVFVLHLIMTANFLAIPRLLREEVQLAPVEHWKIYLPVFVASFVCAVPMIIMAEKHRRIRQMLLISIVLLIGAEALLATTYPHIVLLVTGVLVFFIGFNFLEAVQPSLVAKYAAIDSKGTAMGVYNSAQFLGIFTGGALGGLVYQHWGSSGLFSVNAVMAVLWLLLAWPLPQPKFYTSQIIRLENSVGDWHELQENLSRIAGVHEVVIVAQERLAYLKVDKSRLDTDALRAISGTSA